MIMMRAVIDNNRRLHRKTYCYFADTYVNSFFLQIVAKRLFGRIMESWNEGEGRIHVI